MSKILIIFKKELLDTLRDRRTVIIMILLPLLVFPVLMTFMARLTVSHAHKAMDKTLKIVYLSNGNAQPLTDLFQKEEKIQLMDIESKDTAKQMIKEGKLDYLITVEENFDQKISLKQTSEIRIFYKLSKEIEITKKRLHKIFKKIKDQYLTARLKEVNLNKEFIKPINISEIDISSVQEKIGYYAGGILPYMFILFCFFGAMYPAIDLGAGEKERSTIETLLASPVSRLEIVIGKFLLVFMAGLTSAFLAITGMFVAIKQIPDIPPQILESIIRIIELKSIILMLSLLVPLCALFAAVLLSFSIFANSFKEAQSIITPMNFLVILPAIAGMLPGVKLSIVTAFIPILNISLATKEIISGTINSGLLVIVYLVMFGLAGLSLLFCSKWFNRESVIFRGI
jgi:sodium transport system permease protein